MSGIFGVASKKDCAEILLYGTDYHSHLGTEYGGVTVLGDDFARQIHNISQSQFKSKFFEDCKHMKGKLLTTTEPCGPPPATVSSPYLGKNFPASGILRPAIC